MNQIFFGRHLGGRLLDYFAERVLAIWESLLLKLIQDKECWVFYAVIPTLEILTLSLAFTYLPSDFASIFYYLLKIFRSYDPAITSIRHATTNTAFTWLVMPMKWHRRRVHWKKFWKLSSSNSNYEYASYFTSITFTDCITRITKYFHYFKFTSFKISVSYYIWTRIFFISYMATMAKYWALLWKQPL